MAEGLTDSSFVLPERPQFSLECFAVTDGEGVSPSVEAMGYDPYPAPEEPVLLTDGLWWGDWVTLQSRYLDLWPEGNLLTFGGRTAVASSVVDGGSGYAVEATFAIPDDARGGGAFVTAHGLSPSDAPFLHLHPRGLPDYAGLRAMVYAPQTGRLWVAADGRVDEVDLFRHDPVVVRSLTDYVKPYLSRVGSAGTPLVVDGVAGVSCVDEIDVTTGAVTKYADTHAGTFTRDVLPVGIAVDPDGSAAYLADALYGAGASRLVKIPRNNATAIRDAYGNWTQWTFPDPCGLEVGLSHKVYAGSQNAWIGYCPDATHTYLDAYTVTAPKSLEVDRDVSTPTYDRYYYYGPDPGACMAYNRNDLANGPTSYDARHLGAMVYAEEGRLCVQPLWAYAVEGEAPLRVILNNAGQDVPYPAAEQWDDGRLKLSVRGGRRTVEAEAGRPAGLLSVRPLGELDAQAEPNGGPAVRSQRQRGLDRTPPAGLRALDLLQRAFQRGGHRHPHGLPHGNLLAQTAPAVLGRQLARGGLQDRSQDRPGGPQPSPLPLPHLHRLEARLRRKGQNVSEGRAVV